MLNSTLSRLACSRRCYKLLHVLHSRALHTWLPLTRAQLLPISQRFCRDCNTLAAAAVPCHQQAVRRYLLSSARRPGALHRLRYAVPPAGGLPIPAQQREEARRAAQAARDRQRCEHEQAQDLDDRRAADAARARRRHAAEAPDLRAARLAFFFFFFFFLRKVMPYSRQRKAAKQVMQNLGDGTTPKGVGQERKS